MIVCDECRVREPIYTVVDIGKRPMTVRCVCHACQMLAWRHGHRWIHYELPKTRPKILPDQ